VAWPLPQAVRARVRITNKLIKLNNFVFISNPFLGREFGNSGNSAFFIGTVGDFSPVDLLFWSPSAC
jgi:hypothetical protein